MNRRERTLRLPPALDEKLQQYARENERSVNAEIVHRLQQSLTSWRQDRLNRAGP